MAIASILTPAAIARLAPGSPLLGATSQVLEGIVTEAQLLAESPEAAARPLEQSEFRDVFSVCMGNIITPHYFPLSQQRPPFVELPNPRGAGKVKDWVPTQDWRFTRRGEIRLINVPRVYEARVAYVAGFDFDQPEAGTEDMVDEILLNILAIAEQCYDTYQALERGGTFRADKLYSVKVAAPGRFGALKAKSDAAMRNLRKLRPGYGPLD
ncbi:MAG: hypothetical protein AAGA67_13015 [Cyanobacteria bacterium P01_F01_bin.153]